MPTSRSIGTPLTCLLSRPFSHRLQVSSVIANRKEEIGVGDRRGDFMFTFPRHVVENKFECGTGLVVGFGCGGELMGRMTLLVKCKTSRSMGVFGNASQGLRSGLWWGSGTIAMFRLRGERFVETAPLLDSLSFVGDKLQNAKSKLEMEAHQAAAEEEI